MKRFYFAIKSFCLILITLCIASIKNKDFLKQIYRAYYYDTFNVFHWNNIRFTSAEPNKNFIKTKLILTNPKKYNAFIFGSSRVGNLPPDMLPKTLDGIPLNWYNMTYSEGIPKEHFQTIKTFRKNRIPVKFILLAFDNIQMYASIEEHKKQLLRMPYQVYEENKISFFAPYIQTDIDTSIIKQINEYNFEAHRKASEQFYNYGDFIIFNPSLTENIDLKRYEIRHFGYSQKDSYKDLETIVTFCDQNKIKLILFTNPMYKSLYHNSVEDGYFDLLRKVAQKCEFYNFSSLNNYTTDPRYYFEWSHYRPALGLIIEKYLFGSEKDREQIRRDAGDELFGAKVNAQNVDTIIEGLKKQLQF